MSEPIPAIILLDAYSRGYFPMALESGEIGWFSPERRGVIPLACRRWPHGIRQAIRRRPWEIRCDTAFRQVVKACAERTDTWIDAVILDSYCELATMGRAHSVEVWLEGELVGGLYGVHLGSAFFGESMFHRESGASKVALVALIESLRSAAFSLLDTQWLTPHLRQFGAEEISRADYLSRLSRAIGRSPAFPSVRLFGRNGP